MWPDWGLGVSLTCRLWMKGIGFPKPSTLKPKSSINPKPQRAMGLRVLGASVLGSIGSAKRIVSQGLASRALYRKTSQHSWLTRLVTVVLKRES